MLWHQIPKKHPRFFEKRGILCNSVFRKELCLAIADDGFPGDQANEGTVIINDGHKILMGSPFNEIVHGCSNPDRNVVFPAGNLQNPAAFCLAHIHIAHIFQSPQQVTLCQGTTVFALVIQNGIAA